MGKRQGVGQGCGWEGGGNTGETGRVSRSGPGSGSRTGARLGWEQKREWERGGEGELKLGREKERAKVWERD